jgi:phytoene dehydrogenase-like protein
VRAAVIGGGFAGLVAALELRRRGHEVVLLERRGVLGGRATSFPDAASGDEIDSGTHFLVEGCRQTLALFADAGGQALLSRGASWPPAESNVALELLLNESPNRVHRALKDGLAQEILGSGDATRPVVPRRGLASLHAHLAERLTAAGGTLRRRALATGLWIEDRRVRGISVTQRAESREEIQRGAPPRRTTLAAEVVVAAVPWHALPALLPATWLEAPPFAAASQLGSRRCVSIEGWAEGPPLAEALTPVASGEIRFIVDKGRLRGRQELPQRLAFLVAPEAREARLTNGGWIAAAGRALATVAPKLRLARAIVLREPHAFFAMDEVSNRLRPTAATPIEGLFLAGDWTATGLPACIEGAVRSGLRAAQLAAGA